MENKENEITSSRKSSLAIVSLALVLIVCLLFYAMFELRNKNQSLNQILSQNKADYEEDLGKLEDQIQQQIQETQKLKGENNENKGLIDSLKADLTEVQESRDQLKNTLAITQNQLKEYRDKIEVYEMLLRKKDERIVELRKNLKAQHDKNTALQEKNRVITYNYGKERDKNNKLNQKLDLAGTLKAENLTVKAIENSGKVKDNGRYRASKIDKLNISFDLAENKLAESGDRQLYLRILDPAKAVIVNQDGTSGTFKASGKELNFSAKQLISYYKSQQNIKFKFGRRGKYAPGQYTIEVFCEQEKIGNGSFQIR